MSTYRFDETLKRYGYWPLRRKAPSTLQVNVGKLCNQACHHCHVDAGPKRAERMSADTAERVIEVLQHSPTVETVDLTGGAPELNENFSYLVERARSAGRRVIVRCNLTVMSVPGMEWLPGFYRSNQVELVCSLPCYSEANVDQQRGRGVFTRSIEALKTLNQKGYGHPDSELRLNLVYNPVGAFLPPPQSQLENKYREELAQRYGIVFNRLLTITNMPINRFAEQLRRWGKEEEYMSVLVNHFNPATVPDLMCRSLVSVGYEGTLYDCDFNQMLTLPIRRPRANRPLTVWDIESLTEVSALPITTGSHCFGCTAGSGSSCGGALTESSQSLAANHIADSAT